MTPINSSFTHSEMMYSLQVMIMAHIAVNINLSSGLTDGQHIDFTVIDKTTYFEMIYMLQ